jgi:acetoin utilization deacetylase AcuC-like enzyme
VVYVAGADPYIDDQLGGLCVTYEGLARRDRLVIEESFARHVPVAIVLAGGYAANVSDTVAIQVNTARVAKEVLTAMPWPCGSGSPAP